jgi:hypothetical protein
MPNITEAGKYQVRLRDLAWEQTDHGMALLMPGWANVGGEERHINARLHFTGTLIGGGRNAGKPLYAVNAKICTDIGMSEPFSPGKISELEDAVCEFVVQEEEYKGERRLVVAFVNPLGKKISTDEAEEIWNRLTGGKAPEAGVKPKPKPKKVADDDDDFPF